MLQSNVWVALKQSISYRAHGIDADISNLDLVAQQPIGVPGASWKPQHKDSKPLKETVLVLQ